MNQFAQPNKQMDTHYILFFKQLLPSYLSKAHVCDMNYGIVTYSVAMHNTINNKS